MRPVHRSVSYNGITGDGAELLAKAVLEHTVLANFCSIPLASLRSNSVTELDLEEKGIGVPGAIVLAALLPSATALTSLKCATPCPLSPKVSAAADTFAPPAFAASTKPTSAASTIAAWAGTPPRALSS